MSTAVSINTRKKILVVDDDPGIVILVQRLLENKGYDVITASDGIDAMLEIQHHKPDLIVLDIMMPELNGYEVCRLLKFHSAQRDIPIVIVTSRERELDPRLSMMLGIEYLQKPIDSDLLLSKINAMLQQKQL